MHPKTRWRTPTGSRDNTPDYTQYHSVAQYKPGKSLKHSYAGSRWGFPPFTWDDKLAAYTQWWANQRVNDCSQTPIGPMVKTSSVGAETQTGPLRRLSTLGWRSGNTMITTRTGNTMITTRTPAWTDKTVDSTPKLSGGAQLTSGVLKLGVFITCNYDPPANYLGSQPYFIYRKRLTMELPNHTPHKYQQKSIQHGIAKSIIPCIKLPSPEPTER
ncbi:hypothetical protein Cgig2_031874 [Carnegiea gigantea]|uniref:SCP domain-containing protein n=1 Tax=Carnegiea gigantea TaxID=171969 RepID=A0A9Q1KSB0_9CARY|nr:hypothetical protein Cgig2_031874 [Carnegiea gigantea]